MTASLLTATFQHLLHREAEWRLWRHGIYTWHQLKTMGREILQPREYELAMGNLPASETAYAQRDVLYFLRHLPKDAWPRLVADFGMDWYYLDIETTGLDESSTITLAVIVHQEQANAFIANHNLHLLPAAIPAGAVIVTFNGTTFDLPFLSRSFPSQWPDHLHLDLHHVCTACGYHAGLKRLQAQFGIPRAVASLNGQDAVRLWREHQRGSTNALRQLLRYCAEDAIALPRLCQALYQEAIRQANIPLPIPSMNTWNQVFFDNLSDTLYSGIDA